MYFFEKNSDLQDLSATTADLDRLIGQLEHYRRQSAWLQMVNELHGRLSNALDLPSMVEAFSVWLMPYMEHDLIVFYHPEKQRQYRLCSSHGPKRRHVMECGDRIIQLINAGRYSEHILLQEGRFVVSFFPVDLPGKEQAVVFLLRKGEEISWPDDMDKAAMKEILTDSFHRALEYESLFKQARNDSLTGLANRRVFEERIDAVLKRVRRYKETVTLLSMDLDNFKQLNDSLGHAAGDQALQDVARSLAEMVRDTDLLVRMGGDEFVLVLENTDAAAARELAHRIEQAVSGLDIRTKSGDLLGISIGMTQWQSDFSLEQWLALADEDLYRVKKARKEMVV